MNANTPQRSRKPRALAVGVLIVGALVACGTIAYVATVALDVPVRSEVVEVDTDTPTPEISLRTTEGETGIVDEAETVAALVMTSSQAWAGHITRLEVATMLRRPVIMVSTDIGPEQANLSDDMAVGLSSFASGLLSPEGSPYTYYFRILSAEGDLIGTVSSTDARWKLDVPQPPEDADALRAWLDDVYGQRGPAPEAWASRISSVQTGADGSIIVRTDLDPAESADLRAAQTIIDAVNSSRATFATGVRVLFADGEFEWSSVLVGVDPYSPEQ